MGRTSASKSATAVPRITRSSAPGSHDEHSRIDNSRPRASKQRKAAPSAAFLYSGIWGQGAGLAVVVKPRRSDSVPGRARRTRRGQTNHRNEDSQYKINSDTRPTVPSHKLEPRPTAAQGIDRGNLGVDQRITADSAPKGKRLSEAAPVAKRAAVAGVVGQPRLLSYVLRTDGDSVV
jgi:hypothetical protein